MGWTDLVNMEGGYHGKPDEMGNVSVPGWAACGFESTTTPTAGRTWTELSGPG